MKYSFTLVAILFVHFVYGQKPDGSVPKSTTLGIVIEKTTAAEINDIFNQAYPAESPGAAVLIAKDDKVIYRKAFGMANLELQVPMKPENVFQLASITKQFTSVSILILMEKGKLNLKDPLTKYLPDFPRGNEITLHHLLNHTSGIVSYTNLPEFRTKTRLDLSPEEIISSFKDVPLEFNPGENQAYSNSGYVILGFIIEQLSGMSYGEFIQKNIFDKLGMKNSYYADPYQIIPNRASGYQLYEGNFENPEYMSPTIPYAAGSLLSTIDDMFLWNKAIHQNTLISEKSKQLAFANQTLSNGKAINYGYGWYINEIAGIPTIEHPGGINGYTTSGIYIPESNIYSIVLTNLDDGVGAEPHNIKVVSALVGQPISKKVVEIPEEELKKWVGAYQFDDVLRFISYENGALYSTREGGRPLKLEPYSANEFGFENRSGNYKFSLVNGKKEVLYSDRIDKSIGWETDKKPLSEKESIQLPPAILAKYVGVYELQPSFLIEVEMKNDRLYALAMGQPAIELFAQSENSFFIKEIGAQIVFTSNPDGMVIGLSFSQGGNAMEGKKIK